VSRCKACGESFRKGKRRMILNFDGSVAVGLVCSSCVGRSVSIVTPFPRAGLTVNGVDLLQRVSDRLRTHLTAARMSVPEKRLSEMTDVEHFMRGRVEALSGALELVQRAIAGVEP
jgi:hypothetical protein